MSINNKYVYRSRISEAKFRQLLRLFCLDLTATQIAEVINLSRNSVNNYLKAIRQRMARICETESPFSGQVEVHESYFGARRVKGQRGRGAGGKTIVFGIFKRNGNVYTEVVPDVSERASSGLFEEKLALTASFIPMDGGATTGWWIWVMRNTFLSY